MKKKIILILFLFCSVAYAANYFNAIIAQTILTTSTVGVGATPATGALFQVTTTSKGAIPAPKMTATERDALTNLTAGLMVWSTTSDTLDVYSSAQWQRLNLANKTQSMVGIETCRITNAGTPTVDTASGLCAGWISSITDTGVGISDLVLIAGTFSSVPVCNCVPDSATTSDRSCVINASSTTAVKVRLNNTSGGSVAVDSDFTVICIGKR